MLRANIMAMNKMVGLIADVLADFSAREPTAAVVDGSLGSDALFVHLDVETSFVDVQHTSDDLTVSRNEQTSAVDAIPQNDVYCLIYRLPGKAK